MQKNKQKWGWGWRRRENREKMGRNHNLIHFLINPQKVSVVRSPPHLCILFLCWFLNSLPIETKTCLFCNCEKKCKWVIIILICSSVWYLFPDTICTVINFNMVRRGGNGFVFMGSKTQLRILLFSSGDAIRWQLMGLVEASPQLTQDYVGPILYMLRPHYLRWSPTRAWTYSFSYYLFDFYLFSYEDKLRCVCTDLVIYYWKYFFLFYI